jgi:hypothetical protein
MPPSKSSKAKASWDRARRYADQNGVTVKEARSLLARQKDEPEAQRAGCEMAPNHSAECETPSAKDDVQEAPKSNPIADLCDVLQADARACESAPCWTRTLAKSSRKRSTAEKMAQNPAHSMPTWRV